MELNIDNRLERMPEIVAMVATFGAEHNMPDTLINHLSLVLDEALNNIISYGYPGGRDGRITVRLNYTPGEVSAEVHDDGIAYDPLTAEAPDLGGTVETRKVGGLGVLFIKELMDTVSYVRAGNENRLVMRKKIPT